MSRFSTQRLAPEDMPSAIRVERDRLVAELRSIVLNGTHANHKYETCAVCMAARALGMPVEEAYVRNLPARVHESKAG